MKFVTHLGAHVVEFVADLGDTGFEPPRPFDIARRVGFDAVELVGEFVALSRNAFTFASSTS